MSSVGHANIEARFRRVAMLCGGAAMFLGILALAGWFSGARLLASFGSSYIPMAPDTAMIFILFGAILLIGLTGRGPHFRHLKGVAIAIALMGSVYGLLKFVEYLSGMDLTFENELFPATEKLGSFALRRMSPFTGGLFLLSGSALALSLLRNRIQSSGVGVRNLSGILGWLVTAFGFIAAMGYMFESPLFYGGGTIPLAAPTSLAFVFLGIGLVSSAGPEGIFVRPFVGDSVRARLLRAFLPLTVVAVLVAGLLHELADRITNINHAFFSETIALAFAAVAGVVVISNARTISRTIENAQHERKMAETAARRLAARTEALYRVGQGLASSLDLQHIAELALHEALAVVELDGGVLRNLDDNTQELCFLASEGLPPQLDTKMRTTFGRLKIGEGMAGVVAQGGGPLLAEDIQNDRRFVRADLPESGFYSAVYLPLMSKERIIGTLSGYSKRRRTFSSEDLDALSSLGTMLGMAMANARLFEQVQSGSQEWRQTFDAMADGVALISPEHRILRVNWALADMLGATPKELIGRPCYEVVHGCGEPIKDCPVSRCLADKRPCELVRQEPYLGNRWLQLRADPVLGQQGQVVKVVHTFRDIGDEIAHRLAKEERRTLESIVASMGEGLAVVDAGQRTIYFNAAAEELLGISAGDVLGKTADVYYGLVNARLEGTRDCRSITSEALKNLRKGKPKFTFSIHTPVHREIEGTLFVIERDSWIFGSGAVLRDVTREHEIDRMKTEFISIASHELRTPMTSVYGYSELLLMRAKGLPAEQRRWVETIHSEGKRLSDIIEDLLNVSRIEAGRLTLKLDKVDLAPEINLAIDQLSTGHDLHTISAKIAEGLPPVRADTDKLRQVLGNLVDNAVKYSPQGGAVEIKARLAEGNQAVIISVSDQGMGIPEGDLPKLFTKFHRVTRPETVGIRGTGLGLYIVKSIVEMMGGTITVESEPGKGSTFSFTLELYHVVADGPVGQ